MRRSLRRTSAWVAVAALLTIALVNACGSSDHAGTAPGAGKGKSGAGAADLSALCPLQARSTCEEEAACQPDRFEYPSVDACIHILEGICSASVGFSATGVAGTSTPADYGDINIDWPAYVDCFKKKAALGPSCAPPPDVGTADVEAVRAACDIHKLIKSGSRPAGAPCFVELQCQAGLTCSAMLGAARQSGTCGSCVALAEGAPCEHASDCGLLLGMACDTGSKTCKRYAHAMESCDGRPCDSTENLDCGTDKKCGPLAREGQKCDVVKCDPGLFLYCGARDRVCKPVPRVAGASCKDDYVCGHGLFCNTSSLTCDPVRGDGEPCNRQAGQQCDATKGLACDVSSSTCKSPYGRPGESCDPKGFPAKNCWQSVCVQPSTGPGTCQAFGTEGAACQDQGPTTCAEFLLCTNGVCKSVLDALGSIDASAYADARAGLAACL